jgi:hypothetical protein
MRYDPGQGPTPNVIPASSDSIAELPGGFRILRPGYAALFAVDGSREVEDLIHLRGASIDEVRVSVDGDLPVAKLRLAALDEHDLSAVPLDEFDVALAGALDYAWQSEDESVLEVETFDAVDRVRIRGVQEGETSLLVRAGDAEFALVVEVSPAGTLPPELEPEPRPSIEGDSGPPAPEPDALAEGDSGGGWEPEPREVMDAGGEGKPNQDASAGSSTGDAGAASAADAGSDGGNTELDGGRP